MCTPVEVLVTHKYDGNGTEEEPFLVDCGLQRWLQLSLIGFATLSLTAGSSAYGEGQQDLQRQFHVGGEVTLLGISLDRGVALAVFISTAFVGPAVGPVTGGLIAEMGDGRWIDGYLAFLSGVVTVALVLLASETCAPVLLRRRAARLSKITNKLLSRAVLSPGNFLLEPIALVLTLYMSIIYGVVYLNFDACPVVFQEFRGWGQGVGSLAFLGIVVGVLLALVFVVVFINPRFNAVASRRGGSAYPEDRLEPAIIGGVAALIGLVGFAATSSPNVHYIAPIIFGAPFGSVSSSSFSPSWATLSTPTVSTPPRFSPPTSMSMVMRAWTKYRDTFKLECKFTLPHLTTSEA
ncbi:hypothetical protein EHS25_004838 [Saitozyma podzolica]|uniref:Major facilitator superfamily (MFS) profile domain-containing protein n=1 Tax=Saitozyma podzolica TaxID=1890683 RepID=A0A427Y2W6_9TREE|nr:hypothetical protein EHS25_004838 [Saitozyma podzolica]